MRRSARGGLLPCIPTRRARPLVLDVMPPLTKATLIALFFISIKTASEASPRFIFDAVPEPGLHAEAIRAQKSASSERTPVSKVVHETTKVRYFSPQVFRDTAQVERYLRRTLWISDFNGRGRLLVWPGRAAYQVLSALIALKMPPKEKRGAIQREP